MLDVNITRAHVLNILAERHDPALLARAERTLPDRIDTAELGDVLADEFGVDPEQLAAQSQGAGGESGP